MIGLGVLDHGLCHVDQNMPEDVYHSGTHVGIGLQQVAHVFCNQCAGELKVLKGG